MSTNVWLWWGMLIVGRWGGGGIWELTVLSGQYLCLDPCLNTKRKSMATCPRLKVSSEPSLLTSLAPSAFLIFINDLIIYLRFNINFLLLLFCASNLPVTPFSWNQSHICLSCPPSPFHFPGTRSKGFFSLSILYAALHHFSGETFQKTVSLFSSWHHNLQAHSTTPRIGPRIGQTLVPTHRASYWFLQTSDRPILTSCLSTCWSLSPDCLSPTPADTVLSILQAKT